MIRIMMKIIGTIGTIVRIVIIVMVVVKNRILVIMILGIGPWIED